jgi:hypothetical protein
MAVSVDRKRAQPRRPTLPSLLGDGMPERLRSTSIALIGTVAAIGLGTVAFVLQLGLPSVVSGPLPEPPAKPRAVAERDRVDRTAATEPAAIPAAPSAAGNGGSQVPDSSAPSPTAAGEPSGGAVLVTRPPPARSRPERPAPQPASAESPSAEAPPPAAPPVEPSAAASEVPPPTAEVPPQSPAPTHPGNGNAYGKGNGNGVGNGGEPPGQVAKAAGQVEASE